MVHEPLGAALKPPSGEGASEAAARALASQRGLCAASPEAAWTFALHQAQTAAAQPPPALRLLPRLRADARNSTCQRKRGAAQPHIVSLPFR